MELADDGLPISEVGEWTLEKHDRLRQYVDITRAVRKKWLTPLWPGAKVSGATYIDLFCGPGRSRIQETGQIIDGSPIIAAMKAQESGAPFTNVFIADAEEECVEAAGKRLAMRGIAAKKFIGLAEQTVRDIAPQLEPRALHFAFLDPFKLDDIPFSIIEELARLKRMDMLIHVSVMDLQRNLRRYIDEQGGPLDRVAPRWRDVVDPRDRDERIRVCFLEHWLGLIRRLDMKPSQGIELISGSRNQRLYWLVMISRNPKADELWDKIRNVTPQRRLEF